MAEGGFVKLYRTLLDHPAFRDGQEAMFFAWLVLQARWQPEAGKARYGDRVYELQRGQLVAGQEDLAEGYGWSRKRLRVAISQLERRGMILREWPHGKVRSPVLTICNYERFQPFSAEDEVGQRKGHQMGQREGQRMGQRNLSASDCDETEIQTPGEDAGQRMGQREGQRMGQREGQPYNDKELKNLKKTLGKLSLPSSTRGVDRPALQAMGRTWNEICGDVLPRVTKGTPARLQKMRKRLAEDFGGDLEQWQAYLRRVRASSFLCGEGQQDRERPFRATFDWVLEPRNLAKVLEGNYDDRPGAGRRSAALTRGAI